MALGGVASAAIVAGYIIFLARPSLEAWYPWHPALMSAGTLFLMTLSISLMAPPPRGAPAKPYNDRVWRHFLCNAAAAVLVLGGFGTIWASKAERNKEHFTTWHGQVGLFVSIAMPLQALVSASMLAPQRMTRMLGASGYKKFKKLHRFSALALYVVTFAELFLSFYTNWWTRNVSGASWALFTVLTAFTLFTIIVQVSGVE